MVIAAALAASSAARGQTAYRVRSSTNTPYSSTWSGSAWGTATALPTLATNGLWLQGVQKSSGSEVALGATDSNGAITIMFNTSGTFAAPTTLIATTGYTTVRKFGIAYEQISGNCMIMYANGAGNDADYRIATGGTLSGSNPSAISSTAYVDCVRLIAKAGSNEILALCSDYNSDFRARVWNGSSWGAITVLSTNVVSPFTESFAGAYENTSGDVMVVYNTAASSTPSYRSYIGGVWSSAASMTACSGVPQYIKLAAKPGSNEIVCGILDANNHVRVYIWNGSSWASTIEVTTNAGYSDRRVFDVAYQPDGLKAMVVYGNNSNQPAYRTYSSGSWSGATNMTNMGTTPQWVQAVPGKNAGELFVLVSDAGLDLNVWRWSGTAMGSMATLETSLGGTTTTEPFSMVLRTGLKVSSWQNVNPNP